MSPAGRSCAIACSRIVCQLAGLRQPYLLTALRMFPAGVCCPPVSAAVRCCLLSAATRCPLTMAVHRQPRCLVSVAAAPLSAVCRYLLLSAAVCCLLFAVVCCRPDVCGLPTSVCLLFAAALLLSVHVMLSAVRRLGWPSLAALIPGADVLGWAACVLQRRSAVRRPHRVPHSSVG